MDDSPVQEAVLNVPAVDGDEIDPLDAYMLEIDEQVKALDSKPSSDVQMMSKAEEEAKAGDEEDEEEAAEDEDAKLKAGNFTSVEELIA